MLTINDDCFFWNDEERERIPESRAGGYQVQNNNGDCFPDFKHIVFESVCTWIDGYHLVTSRVVGEEGEIAHLLNKKYH